MGAFGLRLLIPFVLVSQLFGGTTVVPTTTLTAEISNNTSAADSFLTQSNGNLGAGNVSKQPIRSLLYPGATTKVYAHFMAWFGGTNHMDVGYTSDDTAQVHRQVTDMVSRGIDGVIIDWYGNTPNIRSDVVTQMIKQEAEATPGFTFMVSVDKGALKYCTTGCDPTDELIRQLQYVASNYFGSPAYARVNGRPAVTNFDLDRNYTIDWSKVVANVPGNPVFIYQHSSGFTHAYSVGSYSWVMPNSTDPTDWAQSYLQNFYKNAISNSSKYGIGSVYPGFNDTLAAWSKNRIMNRNCGQTWLDTFAQINAQYSATNQLAAIQLNTWNDYEEGTEIESGIDNCVSISASISGDTLNWAISGNSNTLDHYTVFISNDGENLMKVADVPVGTRSLSLKAYGFASGNYKLRVKAVGKPVFANQMSNGVNYTVAGSNQPPDASLTLSTTSGSVPVDVTASTSNSSDPDGRIVSSTIDFGDGTVVTGSTATHSYRKSGTFTVRATVVDNAGSSATATQTVTVGSRQKKFAMSHSPSSLAIEGGRAASIGLTFASSDEPVNIRLKCAGLPVGASCFFSSETVTLPANTMRTVTMNVITLPRLLGQSSRPLSAILATALFPVIGFVGISVRRRGIIFCLLCVAILFFAGCTGLQPSSSSKAGTPVGTYTVMIVADDGSEQLTSPISLTVQ